MCYVLLQSLYTLFSWNFVFFQIVKYFLKIESGLLHQNNHLKLRRKVVRSHMSYAHTFYKGSSVLIKLELVGIDSNFLKKNGIINALKCISRKIQT